MPSLPRATFLPIAFSPGSLTARADYPVHRAAPKPGGKLVIVLSNRSGPPHTFHIGAGLDGASFQRWRYTPDDDQPDGLGKKIDAKRANPAISPELADRTWEFWEQS